MVAYNHDIINNNPYVVSKTQSIFESPQLSQNKFQLIYSNQESNKVYTFYIF